VAVAVDGVTTYDKKGKATYAPRSADEMKRIDDLVRSAVGFTAARGDQVTVLNVRFSHDDDAEGVTAGSPLAGFDKNDVLRGAELFILLVVAALIVFFVARPLLKGATGGPNLPLLIAAGGSNPMLGGGQAQQRHGPADRHRQDRGTGEGVLGQARVRVRREAP
jgi:flagellar M-ring protein FliF